MNFYPKLLSIGVLFLLASCTTISVYEGFCGSSLYHKPGCVYAPVGYTDKDYGQNTYRVTYTMFQEYGQDVVFQNFHRRSMELCSSAEFPGYNLSDFLFEATTIRGGDILFDAYRASGTVACSTSPSVRSVVDLPRTNATRTASSASRNTQLNIGGDLSSGLQCRHDQDQCNARCAGDENCIGACYQTASRCIASSGGTFGSSGNGGTGTPDESSSDFSTPLSLPGQAIPSNECIQLMPFERSPDEVGIFSLHFTNICSSIIYVSVEMLTDKGDITKGECGSDGGGDQIKPGKIGVCVPGGRPAKGDYRNGPPWQFHAFRNSNPDDDKRYGRGNVARAAMQAEIGLVDEE